MTSLVVFGSILNALVTYSQLLTPKGRKCNTKCGVVKQVPSYKKSDRPLLCASKTTAFFVPCFQCTIVRPHLDIIRGNQLDVKTTFDFAV